MAHHSIDIIGIGKDGKLILSDGRKTTVRSKSEVRKIIWKTKTYKVQSFRVVGKSSYNPFEKPIPTDYDDKVEVKVKKDEPDRDWNYSIEWVDDSGNYDIDDPLIAIRSSKRNKKAGSLITKIVSLLSLLAISLFFWQKSKSSK